jgi:hypothetical protein
MVSSRRHCPSETSKHLPGFQLPSCHTSCPVPCPVHPAAVGVVNHAYCLGAPPPHQFLSCVDRLLGLPPECNLVPHAGAKKSLIKSGDGQVAPPQQYAAHHFDGDPLTLSGQVRLSAKICLERRYSAKYVLSEATEPHSSLAWKHRREGHDEEGWFSGDPLQSLAR